MPKIVSYKKYLPRRRLGRKRVMRKRRVYKPTMRIQKAPLIERKYNDTHVNGTVLDYAAPLFTLITGIAQGLTSLTRIGNQITIRSINGQFVFTGTSYPQVIKVAVIYDNQVNGSSGTAAGVYNSLAGNIFPFAQKNYDQRARYTVLKTFEFALNPMVSGIAPQIAKNFYIKGLKLPMIFTGTTGSISDISKGAIYLYMTSSQTSPNAPAVSGYTRITYTDD